jgi:hypothetical protein
MPREVFKTRDEDGTDFEVAWSDGYCQVGATAYLGTRNFCGVENRPESETVGINAKPEFAADELDRLILALQRARREAFGAKPPLAVTMEIVERGRATSDDSMASTIILPNDVRINGVSVLTQGGIKLHELDFHPQREMVTVTVTLPVRMLAVGAEGDLPAVS